MKAKFVPIAPGWQARIDRQTSEHGPLVVLFIEIGKDEEFVWGVDTLGHLIRELARNAQLMRVAQ